MMIPWIPILNLTWNVWVNEKKPRSYYFRSSLKTKEIELKYFRVIGNQTIG